MLFFEQASSVKIEYVDDYYEYIGNNIDKIGLVKDRIFEKESEYRFLIKTNVLNEPPRLLKINTSCLKKIILHVSELDYDLANKICKCFNVSFLEVKRFDYIQ